MHAWRAGAASSYIGPVVAISAGERLERRSGIRMKGGRNGRKGAVTTTLAILLLPCIYAVALSAASSSSCSFVLVRSQVSSRPPPQLRIGRRGDRSRSSACRLLIPALLMCTAGNKNARHVEEFVEVTATGDGRLSHLVRRSLGCGTDEAESLCKLGSVWVRKKSYGRLLGWARRVEDGHVKQGSIVKIFPNPRRFKSSSVDWRERVLLEDDEFIVLEKPSGLPTQATASNFRECVVSSASEALGIKLLGLHRLDMMVSGCIALAKTRTAASLFHSSNQPKSSEPGASVSDGGSSNSNSSNSSSVFSHRKVYLSLSTSHVQEGTHTHWMLPSGSQAAVAFLQKMGQHVDNVGQLSILSDVGGEGLKQCMIHVVRCTEVRVDRRLLFGDEPQLCAAFIKDASIEPASHGGIEWVEAAETRVLLGHVQDDGGHGSMGPTRCPGTEQAHEQDEDGRSEEAMYECEILLLSGRRHQIRCQMSALGAPLWGDTLYAPLASMTAGRGEIAVDRGGGELLARVGPRCCPPARRIGLHCASLGFLGRLSTSRAPWWRPTGGWHSDTAGVGG